VHLRFALGLCLLVLAVTAPASGAAPADVTYKLPRDTDPTRIVPAPDGSVWIVEGFGSIARLDQIGRVTEFRKSGDVTDIALGPDGTAWLADVGVLRIDRTGRARRFQLDADHSADAIAADGDGLWVAEGGLHPQLEHIGGPRRTVAVPGPLPGFVGLAVAADGAVWWTSIGERDAGWIGRMAADGRFSRWVLPPALRDPGRIVAGADGAMWFTARHAIGRISADGVISQLPLAMSPHDLTTGADGVWFTSDICLGRIDASGALTLRPVSGAVQLEGIASAAGGEVWLADKGGNVIRRFLPLAPAPCGQPTFTRTRGPVAATVSFERAYTDAFTDMHIQIAREGKVVYSAAVPGRSGNEAYGNGSGVSIRDLDGDGEPEVTLLLNRNGAHCCSWSRIFRYDRARDTYIVSTHMWGNGGTEPVLRDLNGDHRLEALSFDDRFSYAFTGYATSAWPIRIWTYRSGDFRNVTRRYPKRIRRDADKLWRLYLKHRKTDARGILPAWAADEYMLGHADEVDRVLANAAARGELKADDFPPRTARGYIKALKKLLRKYGYAR
jgi:streptogramin lyase